MVIKKQEVPTVLSAQHAQEITNDLTFPSMEHDHASAVN